MLVVVNTVQEELILSVSLRKGLLWSLISWYCQSSKLWNALCSFITLISELDVLLFLLCPSKPRYWPNLQTDTSQMAALLRHRTALPRLASWFWYFLVVQTRPCSCHVLCEKGLASPCATAGLQQGAAVRKSALTWTLTLWRNPEARELWGFSLFFSLRSFNKAPLLNLRWGKRAKIGAKHVLSAK